MSIVLRNPFRSIERWDPFHKETLADIDRVRRDMEHIFERWAPFYEGRDFVPSAEMDETDTEVHLKLELPGLDAKDLNIEVTENSVSIRGERKSESKTEEEGRFHSEFHYGKFERVIPMPTAILTDNVKAEYKDGILRMTLPKTEEEQRKVVKIEVS